LSDDQNLDIEDQEREEILEEIDELVATNRLPVSEDMGNLKPQKSGAGFPLLINLFAIAAVLSTFYFSSRLFEQKQEDLSLDNASYLSAEGKLLEELKKESAAKLEEKDQEIGAIQDELAELDRQSRELTESMDQQIADRETELRIALEAELEEERAKLKAQGKSDTDIESELRQIEQQRSLEYETELASFRAETEQAISEKEEELALAKALNEELLAEVNTEKERIQDETRKRESELTEQFEAEKAALAEEAAEAEAQLERLTANQAKEALIIDQINGAYESIFALLKAGNSEAALNQIETLKVIIDDPGIATLKSVQQRSTNDRDIIEIIREKAEEQAYKDDVDTTSLTAAADLLLSAQEIATLGTEAYRTGNRADAEEYYTRSLEKIPALKQAWQNLDQIKQNIESERLSALIAEGKALEEQGLQAEASEQYAKAATAAFTYNPELLKKAVTGIVDSSEAQKRLLLGSREQQLAASNDMITKLESSLEQTEGSFLSRIADLNAGWEDRLNTVNTEYESKIAESEADYESRLLNAGTDINSIEGKKNEEINRLTQALGERNQENLELETALAEAENTIEEGRAYIAELEASSAAGIEELRSALTTEIADIKAASEAEIEKLKAASLANSEGARTATSAEIEEIQAAADDEIAMAKADAETEIKEMTAESESKISELNDKLATVEADYDLLEEKYKLSLETSGSQLRASQVAGYNNGIKEGRTNALEDILSFTAYLDGSAELNTEAENKIFELSESEALYGETIQKIQEFAASGSASEAAEIITVAQSVLIGTISYTSGNSIIIEPLSNLELESGMRITIKRKERGKDEYYITFGVITSVSTGRIGARTDPAGTVAAQSLDLVYITR